MAAVYTGQNPQRMKKLILLAPPSCSRFNPYRSPAWRCPSCSITAAGTTLSPRLTREIAEGDTRITCHAVDDDHSLHATFEGMPWDRLLEP